MKKCPFCAEEVQDEAVKCKHCHSELSKQSMTPKVDPVPTELPKTEHATGSKESEGMFSGLLSILKLPYFRLPLWFLYFTIFIVNLWQTPILNLCFLLPPIWGIKTKKDNAKITERLKAWKSHKIRLISSLVLIFFAISFVGMNAAKKTSDDTKSIDEIIAESQQGILDFNSSPTSTSTSLTSRVEIKPSYTISSKIEDLVYEKDVSASVLTYDDVTGKKEIKVDINLNDFTVYSMLHVYAYNILKTVDGASLEAEIDRITIVFKQNLVDTYGQEQNTQVMYIRMSRETWEKVNWETFPIDNIPSIADVYTVHDAILN